MDKLIGILTDQDLINAVKELGPGLIIVFLVIYILIKSKIYIKYDPYKKNKDDDDI